MLNLVSLDEVLEIDHLEVVEVAELEGLVSIHGSELMQSGVEEPALAFETDDGEGCCHEHDE